MKRCLFILSLLFLLVACDSGSDDVSSFDTDLLLDPQHGGGAAWGQADCSACHAIGVIHQNAAQIRDIVQQHGHDSCTGCHGSNGSDAKRQCLICHNNADLPVSPIQSGKHQHDFTTGSDVALQDKQCIDCHYAPDMDGKFEINRDLTRYPDKNGVRSPYASSADFCLRCHNRDHQQDRFPLADKTFDDTLIAIENSYSLVDKHGEISSAGNGTYAGLRADYVYGSRVECTDCHVMHGSNNIKLIIDRSDKGSSKLDPAIRYLPYPVHVAGDDFSQLCVLCHSMDILQDQGDVDTGNGLSGVHITGSSCIECHSHGEAVQAGL